MPDILCLVNTDSCGWLFLISYPPFYISFCGCRPVYYMQRTIIYIALLMRLSASSNSSDVLPTQTEDDSINCRIHTIAHLYMGYLLFEESNSSSCFSRFNEFIVWSRFSCSSFVSCPFLHASAILSTLSELYRDRGNFQRKHHSGDHIIPVELLNETWLPVYGDCHL